MAFPQQRLRRTRRTAGLRELVRETELSSEDLIYPIFVTAGEDVRNPVASMPGIFQLSINNAVAEAQRAHGLGIPAVLLFGIPDLKDEAATGAYDSEGVVQLATRAIKEAEPELLVVTDVCLCEYTSHGHCGVVEKETGEVLNDVSLELLARTASSQAEAGADIVAPSDMMDGRVAAIRSELDNEGFENTPIMAYAAKYASAFYGPFREAADSAPQFGDRRSYQMDPANAREALVETSLDVEEGADIVMVKPALPYLDVLRRVRETTNLPVAAYNVSGEYAMVKAAVQNGWLDEQRAVLEALTGIKRAGADIIITYHAPDVDRPAFFEDDGDRPVAAGEFEHSPAGFLVPFHVVLDEVDPAPLQVLAGRLAVGTAGRGVKLYLFHCSSSLHVYSSILSSEGTTRDCSHDSYGLRWRRDREDSLYVP
jgi:porphobilinogen synthase